MDSTTELPPNILPKITLPIWAYVALVIVGGPIAMAWLTNGDLKTAAAGALTTLLGTVGLGAYTVPKIKAAAVAHQQFNLGAGYVVGQQAAQAELVKQPPIAPPPAMRRPLRRRT